MKKVTVRTIAELGANARNSLVDLHRIACFTRLLRALVPNSAIVRTVTEEAINQRILLRQIREYSSLYARIAA